MTRDEQIKKELTITPTIKSTDDLSVLHFTDGYNKGLIDGAEWADSHPNWHKYPEEKPPLGQRILIYTTKGRIAETMWYQPMLVSGEPHGEPTFEDNRYNKHNVIAWMELPEPPKFD